MKNKLLAILALGLLAGPMAANATLIDFEGYANGTNLHGVDLGGVTLTGNAGTVQVLSNNAVGASFKSPVNSISPFGDFILHGIFDSPTSFVSLWAGDVGGDTDSWMLEIFDGSNNSLGSVASGNWNGQPYLQLSLVGANIMSFVATFTGSAAGIAYDDLEFDSVTVPEPGALALLGLGLLGLGFSRRRKTA